MLLLPFYDKAFTIDDTLFLREAQQALAQPLRPAAFEVVWDQDVPIRGSAGLWITGPVTAYLLIPAVLAGGSEFVAHLVEMVLLCCAVMATISLALRLRYTRGEAALAGMFLVTSPAVMGMATTAMPDVPAMTFGVLAIERFAAWLEEARLRQAIAATVLFSLAVLTRSHMVSLLVVAYVFARTHPLRKPSGCWWLPLPAAVVLSGTFLLIAYDGAPGKPGIYQTLRPLFPLHAIPRNMLAFGGNWVLTFPLGLAWILHKGPDLRRHVATCMLLVPLMLLPTSIPVWLFPVAALGYAAIFDPIWSALQMGDRLRLFLGVWLLMGLPTVFYLHHAPKYEVPAAPAAALLIVYWLRNAPRRWLIATAATLIIGGAMLGSAIVRADATLAGIGRDAALKLIKPAVDSGIRVWFAGHWGYQWYAEEAGAHPLARTAPFPQSGDLIVSSAVDDCPALSYFPDRQLMERRVYAVEGGRVMNRQSHAGFFSNTWGNLPWSWGHGEINRFEVWRMK